MLSRLLCWIGLHHFTLFNIRNNGDFCDRKGCKAFKGRK
jgi:hypothetical protein